MKTMTLTGDHTLTGYENLAGYHIEGNCLEREGIHDGDIILVDFGKCPRPLSDGVRDICLCYASVAPIGRQSLMAKVYTGSRNGHHMGTTAYSEQPDHEVNISRVLGVVAAVFTSKGEFKRKWDISECPTELITEDIPSTVPGTVQLQMVRLPVMQATGGIYDTVEGCTLSNHLTREQCRAMSVAFETVDYMTKRRMVFSPKPSEYLARAKWWREFLHSILNPKEVHSAMVHLSNRYRRCIIGDKTGVWR